jgi:hypothetical protein
MLLASFYQTYAHLSMGEMQTLRNSLLNFLLGHRVRVSVFLRQNVQNTDGSFIIPTSGPVALGNAVNRSSKNLLLMGSIKLYFILLSEQHKPTDISVENCKIINFT